MTAPRPPGSKVANRFGMYLVGVAIGCVLVGAMLFMRQFFAPAQTAGGPNRPPPAQGP
ncbi:MAG: hypothetical protein IPJ41_10145 [Phycisphaerales bacterium]|nr:hypothetical protein [Phycisphaerales bacterium]